jgi:hypothetical protein
MRHTLVILYFAAIYYILRPVPSPELPAIPASEPSVQPEASPPPVVAAAPKLNWEPPTRALPEASTPITSNSGELPAATPPPSKSIVLTLEPAGQQPASPPSAAEPEEDEDAVEDQVQRELARLACLVGKPEKAWGKKSRAAMRRFARRAKIKDLDPDRAMLRMMRGYPANYCKSCRPGRAACDVAATGAAAKKSATIAATTATDRPGQALDAATAAEPGMLPEAPAAAPAATSYLPPWMIDQKEAKAGGESQADEQEAATPKPKKKAKRRRPSRNVNSARRRYVNPYRYYGYGGPWPRMGGWSY